MNQEDLLISKSNFVEFRNTNIQDYYILEKEIGKGAYGQVYRAKEKNEEGKFRAVKRILKKTVKNPNSLKNQIQNLVELDHPTILKVYEVFQDENCIYIVTDLCEGGEIFDKLEQIGSFSEKDARSVFTQIIDAINYCHKFRVAHRDLKPQNLLFLNTSGMSVKLIDFGLSFKWKQNMQQQLIEKGDTKLVGTSYYIAPQIIAGSYDQRCDLWSLGVILYILVTAIPPFDGNNDRQIIQSVKNGHYTFNIPQMKNISLECKDLIKKLLTPDNQRLTIDQVFQHPWMKINLSSDPLPVSFKKMSDFCKYSKLKKITANFIASKFSEKQVEKLSELFKKVDTNHDGALSVQQLTKALQSEKDHPSFQQLKQIIRGVDTDHNGVINYTQFIASSFQSAKIFTKDNLQRFFKSIDKDCNGSVDKNELREVLQKNNFSQLHGKQIQEIMNECDKNGDGKIDFNQFCAAII